MAQKEAKARLKINKLLEEAGWRLLDDSENYLRANVEVEPRTTIRKDNPNERLENEADFGDNYEHLKTGFIDYLLLDENRRPLAVLEAKRQDIPPLSAKEQARAYAESKNARYIILSNGDIHYLWDTENGNPEPISKFPTQKSLSQYTDFKLDLDALKREQIDENYLAKSQMADFDSDPDYLAGGERRDDFIKRNKLKILRYYQVEAVRTIQEQASETKRRFLLEMATGTGKTLTCAAIIRLFMKTGNARRTLFLVDRLELENQAKSAFNGVFGDTRKVLVYKEDRDDWASADILVTTVQSLQAHNRYRDFSPTDFDLVISDEAHRSIAGNARAVFEYFTGWKVGLTATPKDYLRNTSEAENSEREFEKRQLLDTYRTFGCESGEPTYRYDLARGVQDGYLVNPYVIDVRTDITTELLSKEGLSIHKIVTDTDNKEAELEEVFTRSDYEKRFTNEQTNYAMCQAFLDHGQCDPISGEFGKSIVFAVSQSHAAKLTNILNKLAMERWPDKYRHSDFAIQITSQVADAQQMTIDFANNLLLGTSQWLDYYSTSRARVAVTVAMMTTGYDCSDLQNLAFMRPVFSPSDFIQMKGRGTRLHAFVRKYDENGFELDEPETAKKQNFNLIDFFAVCEYFENDFDYNAAIELPKPREQKHITLPPIPPTIITETVELGEADQLKTVQATTLGAEGMKIDREMFKSFQRELQNDVELNNLYAKDKDKAAEYLKNKVFDRPNYYMNLEKIRRFFKLDRLLSLRETLDIILKNTKPLTRDDKIRSYFDDMVATKDLTAKFETDPNLHSVAYGLFDAYISDKAVRENIDRHEFAKLSQTSSFSLSDYKVLRNAELADLIIQYIKDYVPIDKLQPLR